MFFDTDIAIRSPKEQEDFRIAVAISEWEYCVEKVYKEVKKVGGEK